jgi:hypothetical protein
MIKSLNKFGVKGMYLNKIEARYNQPRVNIIRNLGKLKIFPLRSEIRQESLLPTLLFILAMKVLARAIGHDK